MEEENRESTAPLSVQRTVNCISGSFIKLSSSQYTVASAK